ncbi:hypothetical protein D3C84_914390 [compost metagenome]
MGFGPGQRQIGCRTGHPHQVRRSPGPQQGHGSFDAITAGKQVSADDVLNDGSIQLPGVDILASAGVKDDRIQRAPLLSNPFADFTHGLAVGQVTSHHHHPSWIALGQDFQRCHRA